MPVEPNTTMSFTPRQPAFLVGITGYMELDAETKAALRPRLVSIFRFLRYGPDALEELLNCLAPGSTNPQMREVYAEALGHWKGLHNTPIILLSALAPGADTLAVQVALDPATLKGDSDRILVRAPLAFPLDWYRKGTTFVRPDEDPRKNAARLEDLDMLLTQIGNVKSNCFAVRLQDDLKLNNEQLESRYESQYCGDAGRAGRHQRFYAAGEYLAVHSHLLLAIWNGADEQTQTGTAAVVRARLSGPRPRTLAGTQDSVLPHGGPLLHLSASRSGDAPCPLPAIRFLHPFIFASDSETVDGEQNEGPSSEIPCASGAAEPQIVGEGQERAPMLQMRQLSSFVNAAMNLERFNAERLGNNSDRDRKKLDQKFEEMFLGGRELRKTPRGEHEAKELTQGLAKLEKVIGEKCADCWSALRLVSDVRRKAADINHALSAESTKTVWVLFLFAFIAAFALHIFAEWDAKKDPNCAVDRIRLICGGVSLLAGISGIAFFFVHQRERVEDREHDYRAIAEGLRVQFYWNLAGLGKSASSSYMQRQRSELDWIRGVVRSLNFPYHRWSDWFKTLGPMDQYLALACVHRGWVQDQLNYYAGKFKQHHYDQHSAHRAAYALAYTAIWLVIICWVKLIWTTANAVPENPSLWGAIGLLALSFAAVTTGWTRCDQAKHGLNNHGTTGCKKQFWQKLVEIFVPADRENEHSWTAWVVGILGYMPLSLGLAALTEMIAVSFSPADVRWTPNCEHLEMITTGTFLLAAGLAIAYAEKKRFSELAYQFNMMALLFTHADLRMTAELATLKPLAESIERDRANVLVDGRSADARKFDDKLVEIQNFLEALGKEALDEHAEWLLLHRARPLEPVMPS